MEVESNVRRGVRLMRDYSAILGMPEIEVTVNIYVYRDLDKLIEAHHELTGESRDEIRRWAAQRCIPAGLRDVQNNDLDDLGLPDCG